VVVVAVATSLAFYPLTQIADKKAGKSKRKERESKALPFPFPLD
jgi:hypothetical protein